MTAMYRESIVLVYTMAIRLFNVKSPTEQMLTHCQSGDKKENLLKIPEFCLQQVHLKITFAVYNVILMFQDMLNPSSVGHDQVVLSSNSGL